MTPQQFIAKWQAANLSERAACQEHFLDLCELLGQDKPAAADPEGAWYCFERGVSKTEGGHGWADVWMQGHFGWEYKGKHKDLKAAYAQLLQYRESLQISRVSRANYFRNSARSVRIYRPLFDPFFNGHIGRRRQRERLLPTS